MTNDKKRFYAEVRQQLLKTQVGGYALADVAEALTDVFDKCAPQEFVLVKFELFNAEGKPVKQTIVADDTNIIENYDCTECDLCIKALQRLFGDDINVAKEKIMLYADDASVLYEDLQEFVGRCFESEWATELFFKEMEVKAANRKLANTTAM